MQVAAVGDMLSAIEEKTYELDDMFSDKSIDYQTAYRILEEYDFEIDENIYTIDGEGVEFTNIHALNALLSLSKKYEACRWGFQNVEKFSEEFFECFILGTFSYLKTLTIESCNLTDQQISQIHLLEEVEEFWVKDMSFEDYQWKSLLGEIKQLKNLKCLVLSHVDLDTNKLKSLKNALKGNDRLITLVLKNNEINDEGAKQIGKMLGYRHLEKVYSLGLGSNKITDIGLALLLKSNSQLKLLDISENKLNKHAIDFLKNNGKRIECINLSGNPNVDINKLIQLSEKGKLKRVFADNIPIDREELVQTVKKHKSNDSRKFKMDLNLPLSDHMHLSQQVNPYGMHLLTDPIKMIESEQKITQDLIDFVFSIKKEKRIESYELLLEKQFDFLTDYDDDWNDSLLDALCEASGITYDELENRCKVYLEMNVMTEQEEVFDPEFLLKKGILSSVLGNLCIEIFDIDTPPELEDGVMSGVSYGEKASNPLYLFKVDDSFYAMKRKEA